MVVNSLLVGSMKTALLLGMRLREELETKTLIEVVNLSAIKLLLCVDALEETADDTMVVNLLLVGSMKTALLLGMRLREELETKTSIEVVNLSAIKLLLCVEATA